MTDDDLALSPIWLNFHEKGPDQKKHWRENLSAVATHGNTLFATDDENPAICRLVAEGDDFKHFDTIALASLGADLPGGAKGEMDIEGLGVEGDHLWIVGSHALAREQPKRKDDYTQALARLVEVRDDPNRHFLGYVSIGAATNGGPADLGAGAHLPMRKGEGGLLDLLADDPYLGRFLGVPAKENGFDIEGLAAVDDGRVFLGLRGPVLRGWAILLELRLKETRDGRLEPAPINFGGPLYHKHFLDLAGLGLRELTHVGNGLLLLAGPTMDLDGPVYLYRWRDALSVTDDSLVHAEKIGPPILRVPYGSGNDHAEGMTLLGGDRLLVIYDSPDDKKRFRGETDVLADVFHL
jgi:Protein of unknown function (DUF3616)